MSNFDLGPLTRESRRPQWIRDHPHAPWAAVAAVCLGAVMGQLDASIVTLTYPRLQSEFATGLGSVAWVSLSYLVVLAVLLVPVGRWADARGRKLLYLYGFGLFSLASAACALCADPGLARGRARVPSRGGCTVTGQQRGAGCAQRPPIPGADRARFSGSRPGAWPGPGTYLGWGAGGHVWVAVGVLGERPGWSGRDRGRACSSAAQLGPCPATGQRRVRLRPARGRGHVDSVGPERFVRH